MSEPCPDEKAWTGKYRNEYYGFSIVIPPGRKGFWNSGRCDKDEKIGCVCMGTDHGRTIPLSDTASIEAYSGFQMESEWSLKDYVAQRITALKKREDAEQLKVLSSRSIRLGKLKARRLIAGFTEKRKDIVIDYVIALRAGVEYELVLQTLAGDYQKERPEFEKVIASWKLIPARQ